MVKIIADTTSCLPKEVQNQYQIPVIPQMIHFGEKSYAEGKDIDIDHFLSLLRSSSELPKTSAPSPELFSRIFSSHQDPEEAIICIHPSAELSGTIRAAETAKLDFDHLDIRVIDTRLVASPLGVVVHQAAKLAKEGKSADEICDRVIQLSKHCKIYFLVATLEYLARGGRIGGASALFGNALQIKPILTVINGVVEQHSKERTMAKAVQHLKTLVVEEFVPGNQGQLSIMHADNLNLAEELAADFKARLNISDPIISDLPPAIITHAGPGSIGVGFFV
jgi:DegV family protein with EDD domain